MLRTSLALALCLGLATAAVADDPPEADEVAAKVRQNPDDTEAINQYMIVQSGAFMQALQAKPEEAEAILGRIRATFEGLEPTTDQAKAMHGRVQAALKAYGDRLELARVSLDDLGAKLREEPKSAEALSRFTAKAMAELQSLASTDAEAARTLLAEARGLLAEVKAKGAEASDASLRNLESIARQIDAEAKRGEIVGKAAAPLNVAAWVNGSPLTDEELKGKVVLLDFWAVWCGPCIATFPHLREWNEKYADKGLVIIGLTQYYGYEWDEKADRAVSAKGEVSHQDEHAMLEKFAAHYELKHRFAVSEGRELSEFYGVTGIPQAVVIDRDGKVRMVKVGSGEANAKALEAEIEKLLETPAAGGE